jgi:predicted outer membrane repeat protein
MAVLSCDPTVADCVFTGSTVGAGGGIPLLAGAPAISNRVLDANSAVDGGGTHARGSSGEPALTSAICTFSNNEASANGGGLKSEGRESTFVGCSFAGNTADVGEGSVCPTFWRCLRPGGPAGPAAASPTSISTAPWA